MRTYLSAFIIIIIGVSVLGIINVFGTGSAAVSSPSISSEKAKEIKVEFQKIMPEIKDVTKIAMPSVENFQNVQESILINPDGNTKITKGAVTSVNTDGKILDVKIWGLTVRADISETMMLSGKCPLAEYQCPACVAGYVCEPCLPPPPCQIEIEKFNVGDFVNLSGWMADKESVPPIVKAKYIKNISGTQLEIQKIKDQIEQLLKRLRELQQQLGIPQTSINQIPLKSCPADAKICPDGTKVFRVGQNCEFAPCPNQTTAFSITLLAPNSGEWKMGNTYAIQWKQTQDASVSIKLQNKQLTEGYSPWYQAAIYDFSGKSGKNTHNWTVPANLNPHTGYEICVSGSFNANPAFEDCSEPPFYISSQAAEQSTTTNAQ